VKDLGRNRKPRKKTVEMRGIEKDKPAETYRPWRNLEDREREG